MSDILCVTNRKLCAETFRSPEGGASSAEKRFLDRIDRIARCRPAGIILREKDLPEAEYRELARRVLAVCERRGTPCILHSFADAALELRADALHLPLSVLRALPAEKRKRFRVLGVSCHSAEDAGEAEALGCTYITAGHIFATDCKAGLPGRGLDFLREICENVKLPVYAIGGIDRDNIAAVRRAGAAGACVMSGCMQCEDTAAYLSGLS
ncbi:MAG: thiamine phosphate synthase [Lachnospiraceae bacterium]|nr:thiamine phosphate synthase [Lachnospiraceae bacterium]